MTDYDIDFLAAYSEEVAVAHEGFGRKDKAKWHRAIAQILRDSKWVSVEDELPNTAKPYHCQITAIGPEGKPYVSCTSYLPAYGGFSHYHYPVTHWKPVPKPPKQSGGEP